MDGDSSQFDNSFNAVLEHATGEVVFGLNVLDTLIGAIRSATSSGYEPGGHPPAVLGCAMALNDPDLMQALEDADNACIVITKQEAWRHSKESWTKLVEFSQTHDLIAWAFPELEDLGPRDDDGQARVVGPHDLMWTNRMRIGAVREVGFRKVGRQQVPLVHAKLALLGHYDRVDHPHGGRRDVFVADRLWIGSANFTTASRSSLEVGLWTSDTAVMEAAYRFLIRLIANSEPLGQGPNHPDPELVPVEFDDEEFAHWAALDDDHHE